MLGIADSGIPQVLQIIRCELMSARYSFAGCGTAGLGTEREFEVTSAGNRIETIGGDFAEAEQMVKRLRGGHLRQRIEAHGAIAGFARSLDGGFGELASGATAAQFRSNVKPLHFTSYIVEFAEGDAAGRL